MKNKNQSFNSFLRQYIRVMGILFFILVLLYGAVSYIFSHKEMRAMLRQELSHASSYLNTMFGGMAYAAYTLAADPSVSSVMSSPLTVDTYLMVKTQQLCDKQKTQASVFGCASIYLYHNQTGIAFVTGLGKLLDADFQDGDFLMTLGQRPMPFLVDRNLSGTRTLTLVTQYSSGVSSRNLGYICFNINSQHLRDQLSGSLQSNYILGFSMNGEDPAIYLSGDGRMPSSGDFSAVNELKTYNIQIRAFYPRQVFLAQFVKGYLRIAGVFFIIFITCNIVLYWSVRSLHRIFRPTIYKLADLYRQSDSWREMTIGDFAESFDRLVSDRQTYGEQLREMKHLVYDKIFDDLLMGRMASVEEFDRMCRHTGVSFAYESFLIACIQISGAESELTEEEKMLSRVFVKSFFTRRNQNEPHMQVVEENAENIGILLNYPHQKHDETLTYFIELISQLKKNLEGNLNISVFVTIVLPVEGIAQIPKAYRCAKANQIYQHIATNTIYMVSNMTEPEANHLVSQHDMDRIISAVNADRLDLARGYVKDLVDYKDGLSVEDFYKLKARLLIVVGIILNQAFLFTRPNVWQRLYQVTERMMKVSGGEKLAEMSQEFLNIISQERIASLSKSESVNRYVHEAYAYIEDNYEHNFAISNIAESLSVNVKYLSRLFKQESGQTMTQYIAGLRLEKAVKLLEQSDLTVQEVGEKVGYNDVRGFIRLFKKAYDKTPSEYRNIIKGKTKNESP